MNVVKCARLFFLISVAIPSEAIGAPSWCSKGTVQAASIQDFISMTSIIRVVKGTFTEDLLQRNFSPGFNGASLTTTELNGTAAEVTAARSLSAVGSGLACGPALVCEQTTQYCITVFRGPAGAPPAHSCADFPESGLSPPTCESIQGLGIGCECTESDGGITVTCTAP